MKQELNQLELFHHWIKKQGAYLYYGFCYYMKGVWIYFYTNRIRIYESDDSKPEEYPIGELARQRIMELKLQRS